MDLTKMVLLDSSTIFVKSKISFKNNKKYLPVHHYGIKFCPSSLVEQKFLSIFLPEAIFDFIRMRPEG